MRWHIFSKYRGTSETSTFEQFFKLFREIVTHTSGDLAEALQWMTEMDKEYHLSNSRYGMGNFIQDLKDKGYLKEDPLEGTIVISPKMEQSIRQSALEEIFGQIKKSNKGEHSSQIIGQGDELSADQRPFHFGDDPESISMTDSIRHAAGLFSGNAPSISEEDLIVNEREMKAQSSTVLMIDISHSMILYGEDRITPAKKVAMALAELIRTRYPKDTLDIITFGNDAERIEIKDLPYLQVRPYHTNTVAGLQLAQDILRRRKNRNKQIFMITDGKPSCLKEGDDYYMNSFGLDRKIVNKTLNEAAICRRLKIPITTFMIARDPYLQSFVEEFTETNNGKAFFTSLNGLGDYIFKDFENNKRKHF